MFSKSKDVRRPVVARSVSVRSLSTSSSRSSLSTWHPDASVRLFIERCHDASPFDDESSLGSETDLTSGCSSPVPPDDLSPISLVPAMLQCKTQAPKMDKIIQNSIFTPDMSTAALVVAARQAAEEAAADAGFYYPVDEPEFYVGFGTLSKKEVMFRRPRRACENRWASTTRRYVDIL